MRYRKLDDDGDMIFGGVFYRDQPEAVAQAVWTRLRLWVGEWFLDTTEGTPYLEAMLGTGKARTIEPAIRTRILQTQGVTGIRDFSLSIDPDTRTAKIAAVIDTEYGTATITGAL